MERLLLSLILAALFAVATPAQEDESAPLTPKAQSTVHPVVTALAMGASKPLHMTGSVSVIRPDHPGGADFMVFGMGGELDSPFGGGFEGDLEIVRTAEGETIIVSKKTAPGFVLYDDGSTRLVELLHGDKKISLGTVETELVKLLDMAGLMATTRKAIAEAEPAAAEKNAATGQYHLELPTALLSPPRSNGNVFIMPMTKILGVKGAFEIDGTSGSIHSMSFDVLRNDPFAMMVAPVEMGGEFEVEIDGGDGVVLDGDQEIVEGAVVEMGLEDFDESKEGATTHYEFTVAQDAEHSRRLKRALHRMRENVEEIDRQR